MTKLLRDFRKHKKLILVRAALLVISRGRNYRVTPINDSPHIAKRQVAQSPHVKRNSNQSGWVTSCSCDSGTSHFLSVWQDQTLQMLLPDTKQVENRQIPSLTQVTSTGKPFCLCLSQENNLFSWREVSHKPLKIEAISKTNHKLSALESIPLIRL